MFFSGCTWAPYFGLHPLPLFLFVMLQARYLIIRHQLWASPNHVQRLIDNPTHQNQDNTQSTLPGCRSTGQPTLLLWLLFPKQCLHWGVLAVLLKKGLWILVGSVRATCPLSNISFYSVWWGSLSSRAGEMIHFNGNVAFYLRGVSIFEPKTSWSHLGALGASGCLLDASWGLLVASWLRFHGQDYTAKITQPRWHNQRPQKSHCLGSHTGIILFLMISECFFINMDLICY